MDNYGKNNKRFVFYMSDDEHARFLIKIQEDGIKKTILIKNFIQSYLNEDPKLQEWLNSELQAKKSARWLSKRKREQKKAALQNTNFNLDQKDVSEIFDVLSKEDDYNE